jgi:uncharacterized coiled-coil DUF342 family protein
MDDETTLGAVHRLLLEVSETRQQVKTIKEHADQILEQNDEYRTLKDELKELTTKRGEMKKVLQADNDYQKIASELDELKFKLKDLGEILSHHLLEYYNETQNTQFTDPNGEVHQVMISAKLGRPA